MALTAPALERVDSVLEAIDLARVRLAGRIDAPRRAQLGQFLTPAPVARQLAAMLHPTGGDVRVLDPGAGIGSLGASAVAQLLSYEVHPSSITLVAYEIDPGLHDGLRQTVAELAEVCSRLEVKFESEIRNTDFLAAGVNQLDGGLFCGQTASYDLVVMNPPYRKMGTQTRERDLCRRIGLETSNLYTAFLGVAAGLLRPGGQMVAIVPRSFANGTYFTSFRQWFTASMAFQRIHVYDSRSHAFSDDGVLQENVIFHALKTPVRPARLAITSSAEPMDEDPTYREVSYDELIRPQDAAKVIHIVADEVNQRIANRIASLPATLADLRLTVSTGRVVDFRATAFLRSDYGAETAPLIYPGHLRGGRVQWPMTSRRKPNALLVSPASRDLLVPEGLYVLTKRFSSKEERRRIVAALYDPDEVWPGPVAFENHVNYFHVDGKGLERTLALGLRTYLNSSLADLYFRQFSGHTQVNAGDLRRLRYPSTDQLRKLGDRAADASHDQEAIDRLINEELFAVTGDAEKDPVRVQQRVNEGTAVLRALGMPRGQLNERSSLTLLALLALRPEDPWSAASDPLRGITPMMEVFREEYGKTYAPNTRETVRRQSVHQFLDAGLIVINPDDPARATNSALTVYQIEASALALFRTYGTDEWEANLETYLASRETLRAKYAAERQMSRIPVTLHDGDEVSFSLSGGGQNVLIKHIVEEFCERWTPGGRVLYIGDTDEKFAHFDADGLGDLGVTIREHGKMPDLIVHDTERNWLVLIEAVTSHGPIDAKRRGELNALFNTSSAPLVYVTAFLDRQSMVRWLPEIAWETEVWCASDPSHLMHFNGERYLGPYER